MRALTLVKKRVVKTRNRLVERKTLSESPGGRVAACATGWRSLIITGIKRAHWFQFPSCTCVYLFPGKNMDVEARPTLRVNDATGLAFRGRCVDRNPRPLSNRPGPESSRAQRAVQPVFNKQICRANLKIVIVLRIRIEVKMNHPISSAVLDFLYDCCEARARLSDPLFCRRDANRDS
jgi:hypothetical protein